MTTDTNKPRAIICDIDGTLARLDPANPRDIYDAQAALDDLLHGPVHRLLCLYHGAGYHIIIVTGRSARDRAVTEAWLAKHAVPYDELYTRADGDVRKDSIVKREIYEAHIGPRFTVDAVIDDRDQVVAMWRQELGLDCFQVNYGAF